MQTQIPSHFNFSFVTCISATTTTQYTHTCLDSICNPAHITRFIETFVLLELYLKSLTLGQFNETFIVLQIRWLGTTYENFERAMQYGRPKYLFIMNPFETLRKIGSRKETCKHRPYRISQSSYLKI